MRRLLLAPAVILAITVAALLGGMVGVAHANTCTVGHFGYPDSFETTVADDTYILGNDASCTGRWYVNEYYQFETGGSWYIPNNHSPFNDMTAETGTGNQCAHTTSDVGSRLCWGTNDGSGGGYWGAGNTGHFSLPTLDRGSGDPQPCVYNWRLVVKFYDWSTNDLLGSSSNESDGSPGGC